MVQEQLVGRGIKDRRVLDAMGEVPREKFVPDHLSLFAYEDGPLPIGRQQTISQPYIVAAMLEAAEIEPHSRVLEIGTGSGYAAAVLARLADEVYTIEREPALARAGQARLAGLGNVHVRVGDGTDGWPEAAPFDAIIAAAGSPSIPPPLQQQLADGGRLIIPVGSSRGHQNLLRIRREGDNYRQDDLGLVAFVPLVGRHGWSR